MSMRTARNERSLGRLVAAAVVSIAAGSMTMTAGMATAQSGWSHTIRVDVDGRVADLPEPATDVPTIRPAPKSVRAGLRTTAVSAPTAQPVATTSEPERAAATADPPPTPHPPTEAPESPVAE